MHVARALLLLSKHFAMQSAVHSMWYAIEIIPYEIEPGIVRGKGATIELAKAAALRTYTTGANGLPFTDFDDLREWLHGSKFDLQLVCI